MDKSPKFFPVIFSTSNSHVHLPAWDQAQTEFQKKEYKKSIHSLLTYINKKYASQTMGGPLTEYRIRHSSAGGVFRVTDTHFEIEFPFVRLPNPCPPALLRQVTEINFSQLGLTRIMLKGDALIFYYRDQLELSAPHKIYDLLREVCSNVDHYDDLFVDKFKAEHLIPPNQQKHSDLNVDRAWEAFQAQLNQAETLMADFEQKRYTTCLLDPAVIFVHQASYTLNPHGILRAHVGEMYQALLTEGPFDSKMKEVRRIFEKMKKIDRPKFNDCMYVTEVFLPDKRALDVEQTKEYLERYLNGSDRERKNHDFISSTCGLLIGSYIILDMHVTPQGIWQVIQAGLSNASEKSWQEASDILFQHFEQAHSVCEALEQAYNTREALEQAGQAMGMMKNFMNQFLGKVS